MMTWLRDTRFGLRLLRRNPGFTAVAILALALGIAANTAIFSVIYATYLEPLSLRNADRLVMVWSRSDGQRELVSPADYLDWKRQATAFEDMNAWSWRPVNLATDERPEHVQVGPATPGFLAMFGYGHPGLQDDVLPAIDLPFFQVPWSRMTVAVRTGGDPAGVRQSIATVVQRLEPDLPLADVSTMEHIVSESMAADRFNTALFGSFAAVALLLAAMGIYGVMAFAVAQRTHEIGIRMALGAGRRRVVGQVLREGMATCFTGVVLGSAGAYYVARSMQGIAPGVTAVEPTAYVAVTVTLLGAAFVACLVPAARAASVDPLIALRQE